MTENEKSIPLAISLPESLVAELDALAAETKQSRSAVMRLAIREGLTAAKSGGKADALVLDSATSREVDTASQEARVSRDKFIMESIRTGLQATYSRLLRDYWVREQEKRPGDKDAEGWVHVLEHSTLMDNPMGREVRAAMRQRGAALVRFHDLLEHVPEAWRRYLLVEKLTEIRRMPGEIGGGVWGMGLSTEEVAWQVRMKEKYGVGASLPDKEIKAREAARKREDVEHRKHRDIVSNALHNQPYPEK